jgi:hypothetical protein
MDFPQPVISLSIEPKTKANQEKFVRGLGQLVPEDQTFRVRTDQQTGQMIITTSTIRIPGGQVRRAVDLWLSRQRSC